MPSKSSLTPSDQHEPSIHQRMRLLKPKPLFTALVALALVVAWFAHQAQQTASPKQGSPSHSPSPLARNLLPLDWGQLNAYQSTITRKEWLHLMETYFATDPSWQDHFLVEERQVRIRKEDQSFFHLRFADPESAIPSPRPWRHPSELTPAPSNRPLEGMRVTIDPGHIGGRWARMEERWFQLNQDKPVQEGDMTLLVGQLLKPKLESLGAIVTFTRDTLEPVTTLRPDTIPADSLPRTANVDPRLLAERLFYRTAEIHARAAKINQELHPDVVLCLHFNAEDWGPSPSSPSLCDHHHLHMIVHGAYTPDEWTDPSQRLQLSLKLLQRLPEIEADLGAEVARSMVAHTSLPPYHYPQGSRNNLNINENPYLWARNLLANRLYMAPVAYFEPYVMNSHPDYLRIQQGDYEGTRIINGKPQPSIFREYAQGAADGLEAWVRKHRSLLPASSH